MGAGEFLTRSTIWITIAAYTIGCASFALPGRKSRWDAAARVAWTTGCASLIAHIICAFQFYHGWSHESAYRDTARQTEEVFGLNWGGGLFINYVLLIAWVVDIAWWWLSGLDSYRSRPWPLVAVWHGFIVFIIFNATVVFADGIVRWVGLCICASLCFAWFLIARQWSTRTQVTLGDN